jgi:hypothetical protein
MSNLNCLGKPCGPEDAEEDDGVPDTADRKLENSLPKLPSSGKGEFPSTEAFEGLREFCGFPD